MMMRRALRQDNDDLALEASRLEAAVGVNPYSSFLRDHGVRPSPEQASCIGRLLGGRVRAFDGKMYPVLTASEKEAVAGIKKRRADFARGFRGANAVRALIARGDATPREAADHADSVAFSLETDDVDKAIAWLLEFRKAMR